MKKWITGPTMLLGLLAMLVIASSASAAGTGQNQGHRGGDVLDPSATPNGYSLSQAAATTAYFNVGPRTPDTLPAIFPFQILYDNGSSTTFTVEPGTMFYVPVVFNTDSPPILAGFPADVTDQAAVEDYFFSPKALGARYIQIKVDGKTTSLKHGYAVGAVTPGLPDTGNNYTVVAAFLTALSPGTHTVTIQAKLMGDSLDPFGGLFEFSTDYTVIVQ